MRQRRNMWGKAGLALLVLLLAATALSAQTKVRVKDPAAVIRIEPAANGEIVQDKVAVGTEFTVERKTGDWYEIKYRSAIGVLLSGFIHQSQVEEIKAEAPVQKTETEPVQKAAVQEEPSARSSQSRIEFSIMGGYGLGSLNGTSSYADDWGTYYVPTIHEGTDIALTSKNTFALGANISYFFTPNIGVQFGGGYFAPSADVTANYVFAWHNTSYNKNETGAWPTTQSKLSSIPIYVDLIAKYRGPSFSVYGTAGPTLFMNSFNADSYAIYGSAAWSGLFLDWFQIPITIPSTSWTAFGFNVAVGAEINFSPSIAFIVEGRYFYAPKKDFAWTWTPGTYNGVPYTFDGGSLNLFQGWTFSDWSAAEGKTTVLTVNPSFLAIMGGIKFFF